ncbi:Uncharacterised protein [Bordetella pertussis]|nr:Uncharacterised protein [Bordetella pertussis]CPO53578.1 Uncharacterised protein [Bordetella pertussis]
MTRASPLSTTKRMPGTVSEVSATLVASTTRRALPRGWKICSCSACDSRAYSGSTSVPTGWRLRSASADSRISRSPGRNTSTSPGPWRAHSSTASTMASIRSRSSSPALRSRPPLAGAAAASSDMGGCTGR